ncbi:RNA deprotection pyrophosphohydrolase [Salibacterium halotolerans]|uniref:8-oxo-dGTP diphosphatase n=1 Tax=Salibacterium halotolerans TaxID=1884432 RepID=A0A1I5R3Z9_9BACI|nr:nucleoside triphosphatase YtkD [Salibacterium halotolerans]SFP53090.1 8-oxo-dGTP diphosphatase [Salibacterium halotolerans]
MKTFTFRDYYNNEVELSYSKEPFSSRPGHVWVICRYDKQWLLTCHPRRGLEFPGGKVEAGETAEKAAIREVWEETGGIVNHITQIGQYKVKGRAETIVKNVYFADVQQIQIRDDYLETMGPVQLKHLPREPDKNYSFIMKDDVLPKALQQIRKRKLTSLSD